ncbi:sulfotransferase family protein [Dyella sp. 20L07]|uniref:sulfotransferase family protein n=1 Tax=Dyella sp. 20L07 TaxID=3384240 RepID=UPI003D2CD3AA
MRRTFVVGCPRSGTTIVQALLARHPAIYTLPETAFFEQLHGDLEWRWGDVRAKAGKRRWRHRLGLARKRDREFFSALQQQLSSGHTPSPRPPLFRAALTEHFTAMLDRSAAAEGRSMWLEKTPNHLLYIAEIEAQLANARFIHVIRRGADVLASLADVYLRFENDLAFGGGTVHWTRRWNRAIQIHGQHVGRANHHFVFLEDLIRHPEAEWNRLCTFLELPPDAPLDNACQQTIANLNHEPWKVSAIHGQVREATRKVDGLFGPDLQRWLDVHLASYDDLHAQCQASQPHRPSPRLRVVRDTRAMGVG